MAWDDIFGNTDWGSYTGNLNTGNYNFGSQFQLPTVNYDQYIDQQNSGYQTPNLSESFYQPSQSYNNLFNTPVANQNNYMDNYNTSGYKFPNQPASPSWFDKGVGWAKENSSWLSPALMGGLGIATPYLQKLMGGKTQAEQQQEAYNQWLQQYQQQTANTQQAMNTETQRAQNLENSNTATAQQTENAATQKAYDNAIASRELTTNQVMNIQNVKNNALKAALEASRKQQASAGFAHPTKDLYTTQGANQILANAMNALATQNSPVYSKATTYKPNTYQTQILPTTTPFPNLSYDESALSKMLGSVGNVGNYVLGQSVGSMFPSAAQKQQAELYKAMAAMMAQQGGY